MQTLMTVRSYFEVAQWLSKICRFKRISMHTHTSSKSYISVDTIRRTLSATSIARMRFWLIKYQLFLSSPKWLTRYPLHAAFHKRSSSIK